MYHTIYRNVPYMALSVHPAELLTVECTYTGDGQLAGHAELDKSPAGSLSLRYMVVEQVWSMLAQEGHLYV